MGPGSHQATQINATLHWIGPASRIVLLSREYQDICTGQTHICSSLHQITRLTRAQSRHHSTAAVAPG